MFVVIPKYLNSFFLFIFFSLLSVVVNSLLLHVDFILSLIFSLREVEYFLFFFVGRFLYLEKFDFKLLGATYIPYGFTISLLANLHIIPTFSSFGVDRWSANTTGPFEFSVVTAMSMSFLMVSRGTSPRPLRYFLFVLGAASLWLSGARITLVAFILILRSLFPAIPSRLIFVGLLIAASVFSFSAIILPVYNEANSNISSSRFHNGADVSEAEQIFSDFGSFTAYKTSKDYEQGTLEASVQSGQQQQDLSAYVRFFKWATLLRSSTTNITSILIGMGPSFGFTAVDGNYVRVFVEDGIVGLLMLTFFFFRLAQRFAFVSIEFRNILILLLISALFIDILESLRPMILFWSYLGYLDQAEKTKNSTRFNYVNNLVSRS